MRSRDMVPSSMDSEFEILEGLSNEVRAFYEEVRKLRITPAGNLDDCRRFIQERFDFESPVPASDLFNDVRELMREWTIHVTHPRSFGNFNPSVTIESIVGDTLIALYNPQLAVCTLPPLSSWRIASWICLRHGLALMSIHRLPTSRQAVPKPT